MPPTDPRFLDATLEEIAADFWAHHYHENKVVEEVEDDDFDQDAIMRKWEQEQAQGIDEDDWEEKPVIDFKSD